MPPTGMMWRRASALCGVRRERRGARWARARGGRRGAWPRGCWRGGRGAARTVRLRGGPRRRDARDAGVSPARLRLAGRGHRGPRARPRRAGGGLARWRMRSGRRFACRRGLCGVAGAGEPAGRRGRRQAARDPACDGVRPAGCHRRRGPAGGGHHAFEARLHRDGVCALAGRRPGRVCRKRRRRLRLFGKPPSWWWRTRR